VFQDSFHVLQFANLSKQLGEPVLLAASHGHADTVNLATGLNSAGVLQTTGDALDANWQVTGAVNPKSPPSAFVVGITSADFSLNWLANGPHSSWIAANPDDIHGNGLETFTQTFTVTYPLKAAIINGAWTIDDAGSLFLNGHLLSTLSLDFNGPILEHTTRLNPFTTTPSDFVVGVNTLTMVTTSTDDNFEGARLQGRLVSGVPRPSVGVPSPSIGTGPLGLIFAGGGLLIWWHRKRRLRW
jgi:hypothetical protein